MSLTTRLAMAWSVLAAAASALAQRTPDEALRALQDGNRRFVAERSVAQPLGEAVRRTLARGETPFAVVVCCTDSRVPPEHVFNTGLGELFVVRVAGHVCDAETLASIEYAVEHLNVPLCVVLGHEACDVVGAAVAQTGDHGGRTGAPASRALQTLLEQIEPAVRRARSRDLGGKPLCDAAEEEHVHHTVHECLRRSDLLRRYASVGRFRMVPARYHLDSGEVEWLPARPLPAPTTAANPLPTQVPAGLPPHVALRMLQAGHRRFLGDGHPTGDLSASRREALTHGQQPLAIVLTCADSRATPEHVFDAGLGELSVIRIAGPTLTDAVLASIEQAAARTGASLLVVMGHTRCSTVQAAIDHQPGAESSPHLQALVARIEPAIAQARLQADRGDLAYQAVRANVLRTVAEARSRSALLRQLEAEGRFALLPVVYDIVTGDLSWQKDTGATEIAGDAEGAAPHTVAGDGPTAAANLAHQPEPHPHEPRPAQHVDPEPEAGEQAEPARHQTGTAWWRDLRHLIGLAGVVSMALAALLLLKPRS